MYVWATDMRTGKRTGKHAIFNHFKLQPLLNEHQPHLVDNYIKHIIYIIYYTEAEC